MLQYKRSGDVIQPARGKTGGRRQSLVRPTMLYMLSCDSWGRKKQNKTFFGGACSFLEPGSKLLTELLGAPGACMLHSNQAFSPLAGQSSELLNHAAKQQQAHRRFGLHQVLVEEAALQQESFGWLLRPVIWHQNVQLYLLEKKNRSQFKHRDISGGLHSMSVPFHYIHG